MCRAWFQREVPRPKGADHRARIAPGLVSPRGDGCFQEAVLDLFAGRRHRGAVRLDASVGSGLAASERQHVCIVDIGRLDLITALAKCRVNFV